MTVTETTPAPPGDSSSPGAVPPGPRHRGRWLLFGFCVLLTAAAVILAVLAGTYQPVQFGNQYGGAYPGLPAGKLQYVNRFGLDTGQVYAPPQAGVFTLVESLANDGPEPVRIEAVSILSPQQQANAADGTPAYPVTPAGAVRWRLQDSSFGLTGPFSGNSVAGRSLVPGQPIVVAIPLRQSGHCYDPNGWMQINAFYVEERFGPFTHWVAVPLMLPLLLHNPSDPGNPEPARDLVCPGGTAK
jgi:hypothetical protein